MTTATFQPGQTYVTRLPGDANIRMAITIERRTAKSIVTTEGKRLRIHVADGVERVMPDGRYSMAPVLSADRPA